MHRQKSPARAHRCRLPIKTSPHVEYPIRTPCVPVSTRPIPNYNASSVARSALRTNPSPVGAAGPRVRGQSHTPPHRQPGGTLRRCPQLARRRCTCRECCMRAKRQEARSERKAKTACTSRVPHSACGAECVAVARCSLCAPRCTFACAHPREAARLEILLNLDHLPASVPATDRASVGTTVKPRSRSR